MRGVPTDIGIVHFVGIGGIGMSGIAEVMHNMGYRVQGSDVAESANVASLRARGVAVAIGHSPANVDGVAVVVCSTAIRRDNPEVAAALAGRVPVVRRSEMLAELMRLKRTVAVAGTHGKTTTTSLIAAMMDSAGLDPTVINGGVINSYGSNARLGEGDWMVVEADESDGSFLRLDGTLAVVTNIDPEHLDHYGSFERVRDAYLEFVENVPFYGVAFLCIDHPEVQALVGRVRDRRIVTYGFAAQADVRATNVRAAAGANCFDVTLRARDAEPVVLSDVALPMAGRHNVLNALAAIGVGQELGFSPEQLRDGFRAFGGVKRRFSRVGTIALDDGEASVIDDYGHHPVEIAAALSAAREQAGVGRVVAVVQPHRYSRLAALMDDFAAAFNDADQVLVLPVYSAGEEPIVGVNADALAGRLRDRGHREALALTGPDALCAHLADAVRAGDVVLCLGAGDITRIAATLGERVGERRRAA